MLVLKSYYFLALKKLDLQTRIIIICTILIFSELITFYKFFTWLHAVRSERDQEDYILNFIQKFQIKDVELLNPKLIKESYLREFFILVYFTFPLSIFGIFGYTFNFFGILWNCDGYLNEMVNWNRILFVSKFIHAGFITMDPTNYIIYDSINQRSQQFPYFIKSLIFFIIFNSVHFYSINSILYYYNELENDPKKYKKCFMSEIKAQESSLYNLEDQINIVNENNEGVESSNEGWFTVSKFNRFDSGTQL